MASPTLIGTEPSDLCQVESNQLETFKFNFDEQISKPQAPAFIRFFEIDVETAVLVIDSSQLGNDAFIGNMLTVAIPDNTLLSGRGYYITLDGGVVTNAAGCSALSVAVTNETTIRFVVDRPCGSKPVFVPDTPLENQCIPFLATEAGRSKNFTVFAKAGARNNGPPDLITRYILSVSPAGVGLVDGIVQTVVNSMSIAELTFTWTPTLAQLGGHPFCIIAVSAAGIQSDQRCFTLTVFTVDLDVLRLTSTEPSTLCNVDSKTLNSFKFNFNTAIAKPQLPAFIRFFQIGVEAPVLEIDSSQLGDDAFVGNMLTVPIPPNTLRTARGYYITLEGGVATGEAGCGTLSLELTNDAILRFFVDQCYEINQYGRTAINLHKMYADCTNCERYMQCMYGGAISRPCPGGTRFDRVMGMCLHKGQTPCEQGPVSDDPCAFVDNGGIIKDPNECPKYIVCEHGVSNPHECDAGTIYSVISHVCEHSETPSCPNGVDRR